MNFIDDCIMYANYKNSTTIFMNFIDDYIIYANYNNTTKEYHFTFLYN